MGSKERRSRERQDTREKILAAARLMFAQHGYEDVTMRAIADRVEYTPTAIYHHFANKQALVTELCDCDFRGLAQHFGRAAAITDPIERIRNVGEAYLEFAIAHPYHYQFMFMTALPELAHSPEYMAGLGNPESDAYTFFRLACEQAIQEQRFRPEFTDSHEIAQLFWAVLHGLISLRIIKKQDIQQWVPWRDLRTSARAAIDAMLRGLLRDPSTMPMSQSAEQDPAGKGAATT